MLIKSPLKSNTPFSRPATIMNTAALIMFFLASSLCYSGEIAEKYHALNIDLKDSTYIERAEFSRKENQITTIGIERTECYGSCPAYFATISIDGVVKYTGIKNVPRKGSYVGKVSVAHIYELIEYINSINYFSLDSSYVGTVSDHPTTYTMVVRNGETKIISNYANSAPKKVWALEEAIDNLLNNTTWAD